jgi:hypothetical protein
MVLSIGVAFTDRAYGGLIVSLEGTCPRANVPMRTT